MSFWWEFSTNEKNPRRWMFEKFKAIKRAAQKSFLFFFLVGIVQEAKGKCLYLEMDSFYHKSQSEMLVEIFKSYKFSFVMMWAGTELKHRCFDVIIIIRIPSLWGLIRKCPAIQKKSSLSTRRHGFRHDVIFLDKNIFMSRFTLNVIWLNEAGNLNRSTNQSLRQRVPQVQFSYWNHHFHIFLNWKSFLHESQLELEQSQAFCLSSCIAMNFPVNFTDSSMSINNNNHRCFRSREHSYHPQTKSFTRA